MVMKVGECAPIYLVAVLQSWLAWCLCSGQTSSGWEPALAAVREVNSTGVRISSPCLLSAIVLVYRARPSLIPNFLECERCLAR